MQEFLAASPDQRQALANHEIDDHPGLQQVLDKLAADPSGEEDSGLLTQVSESCGSYPADTTSATATPSAEPTESAPPSASAEPSATSEAPSASAPAA